MVLPFSSVLMFAQCAHRAGCGVVSNGDGRSLFIRAGSALIAGSCSALIAGSGRELDVSQAARFLSRAKVKGKDARLKHDFFFFTYLYYRVFCWSTKH